MSAIRRMLLGVSIAISAVICPNPLVAHEPAPDARAAELQCILAPGVYAIIDPETGNLVGALIVYPDCKVEILPI
jgi:hypothetical protein